MRARSSIACRRASSTSSITPNNFIASILRARAVGRRKAGAVARVLLLGAHPLRCWVGRHDGYVLVWGEEEKSTET